MTKGKGSNPGLGGLGKHIKSTAHRERGQLQSRKKLGALEKHKDYKKRAEIRHKKDARIHRLKRSAALANPDEFNLKMTQLELDPATGKMKKRVDHSATAKKKRNVEALADNKKDLEYLKFKMREDRQQALDLANDVVGLDMVPQNTHTIFVDEEEDGDLKSFDVVKHLNTTSLEELKRPALRANKNMLATTVLTEQKVKTADDEVEGDEEEGDDYPEQTEAEKRQEKLKERASVALQFREIAERGKRHKHLATLATALEHKQQKLHRIMTAKKGRKFKKGVPVRQR